MAKESIWSVLLKTGIGAGAGVVAAIAGDTLIFSKPGDLEGRKFAVIWKTVYGVGIGVAAPVIGAWTGGIPQGLALGGAMLTYAGRHALNDIIPLFTNTTTTTPTQVTTSATSAASTTDPELLSGPETSGVRTFIIRSDAGKNYRVEGTAQRATLRDESTGQIVAENTPGNVAFTFDVNARRLLALNQSKKRRETIDR